MKRQIIPYECTRAVIAAVILFLGLPVSAQVPEPAAADLTQGGVGKGMDVELPGGVKLAMNYCPAGTVMMGSPANEEGREDGEKQMEVALDSHYWMAATECTQAQWEALMGPLKRDLLPKGADLPVIELDWTRVQAFVAKLNEQMKPPKGWWWSLPSEAQWEHACRAGTTTRFHCGDDPGGVQLQEFAWFAENSGNKVQPVGRKLPNAWGLHDMHGNAWEWVQNWTGDREGELAADPSGEAPGPEPLLRGGDAASGAEDCRSARRITFRYGKPGVYGFRVALVRRPDAIRTETLAGKSPFDVPKEVAEFVAAAIKDDPDLRARYHQRIAAVKELAGGNFQAGQFVAIEWLVNAHTNRRYTAEGGGWDTETVYLVRSPLLSGYSRGYSEPENVVVQVTAEDHTDTVLQERDDSMVVVGSRLVMRLDGFVDVGIALDPVATGE